MDVEGTYYFQNTPIDRVFQAMTDPSIFGRAIPGVERLEAIGEDAYEATVNVGISAVKGVYTGRVQIVDKQPPNHCGLTGEGSGARGFFKGEGWLDLEEKDGHTVANYRGSAQIGGPIAGVGMRMLDGAAKMMANQFFGALAEEMNKQAVPAPATAGAPAGYAAQPSAAGLPAPNPMIQIVRRLRVSDGSPEDEQRWARRLMVAGSGLVVSLFAFVGLLTWLFNRKRR